MGIRLFWDEWVWPRGGFALVTLGGSFSGSLCSDTLGRWVARWMQPSTILTVTKEKGSVTNPLYAWMYVILVVSYVAWGVFWGFGRFLVFLALHISLGARETWFFLYSFEEEWALCRFADAVFHFMWEEDFRKPGMRHV